MSKIHPTSVIDPKANIHDEAEVGPFCVIGPDVTIGRATRLIAHVSVFGKTVIGEGNVIWPQATLGGDPQDLKYAGEDVELIVGDQNDIRENVTINRGTGNGGGKTTVGNNNFLMACSHIAHDSHIGSHCVISNNVMLAGHITVGDHAIISGGAALTHYVTVGQYAFIGGLAGVVHDCPPFMLSDGHPSRVRNVNTVGLKRHRFPEETIGHLKIAYRYLFRPSSNGHSQGKSGNSDDPANVSEGIDRLRCEFPEDECITILTDFIERSAIGVHGRYRESERKDNKWAKMK